VGAHTQYPYSITLNAMAAFSRESSFATVMQDSLMIGLYIQIQ